MICVLFTVPFALTTFSDLTLAEERIQQSCNAYYEVQLININGKKYIFGNAKTKVGEFYAERSCDESVPNTCRRRARDTAHECMTSHLYNQELQLIPEECQPSSYVYDYTISNIKREIEFAACSLHPDSEPALSTFIFSVHSVTEGGKGCGPDLRKIQRKKIIRSYSVTCQRRKKVDTSTNTPTSVME